MKTVDDAVLTLKRMAIATAMPLAPLPMTTTLTRWPSARCSACWVSKNVTVLPVISGDFILNSVIFNTTPLYFI